MKRLFSLPKTVLENILIGAILETRSDDVLIMNAKTIASLSATCRVFYDILKKNDQINNLKLARQDMKLKTDSHQESWKKIHARNEATRKETSSRKITDFICVAIICLAAIIGMTVWLVES